MIIGAQRSGTTALYSYMCEHDCVLAAFRKEVHYFDLHHARGEAWYRAHFPLERALRRDVGCGRVTGEATPNYLFLPSVPPLMHALLPGAKLIVLLRDPVVRAHSSWQLKRATGWEDLPFSDALEAEDRRVSAPLAELEEDKEVESSEFIHHAYLRKGHYAEQLTRWLAFYPRRQMLILQSERLFAQPQDVLERIATFLDLDQPFTSPFPQVHSVSGAALEPSTERALRSYYAPLNETLFEVIGERFDWST